MPGLYGASARTYGSLGAEQLRRLWDSLDFGPLPDSVPRLFQTLIAPWGDRLVGDAPPWPSDVTDDGTPFEFSVAFEGEQRELRILVEAQGAPTTLESSWTAGRDLNERLAREFGISLERFHRIEALFAPRSPSASTRFSLWHAACLRPHSAPDFKLYVNPNIHGPENAGALVEEALSRLGFAHAWSHLRERALIRGSKDRIIYFSLDLANGPKARVKIYIAHEDASATHLESVASSSPHFQAGDACWFFRGLSGGEGPFAGRPPLTCFAFTSDSDRIPSAVTLLLPIRSYASDDQDALQAMARLLAPADASVLVRAVEGHARRPLRDGLGLQSWVSFRRQAGGARFTVYLSPEAYAVAPPRHVGRVAPHEWSVPQPAEVSRRSA